MHLFQFRSKTSKFRLTYIVLDILPFGFVCFLRSSMEQSFFLLFIRSLVLTYTTNRVGLHGKCSPCAPLRRHDNIALKLATLPPLSLASSSNPMFAPMGFMARTVNYVLLRHNTFVGSNK